MFDSIKNLAGLPAMMAKARDMQEKMKTLQEGLATRQFSATSPDGSVTAIVDGKLALLRVRIAALPSDTNTLEMAVVAAVAEAQNNAALSIQSEMEKLTSDMGLPPGLLPG